MTLYKNLTDQELIIPNVGVVAPNGTIETDVELVNSNLSRITNEPAPAPRPPAPAVVQSAQPAQEPTQEEN